LKELALHILDIAQNSISAQATHIVVEVFENIISDRLIIKIQDDGIGMDAEMAKRITDPFVTSRTTRKVGLGIPLLKAAAEACDGCLVIESEVGKGTTVRTEFQLSHIDRMPIGDLEGTFLSLVVGAPDVHWVFRYKVNENQFVFDDEPIKKELDGVPLSNPDVLRFIRGILQEGLTGLRQDFSNRSN
jgi:hypothetical protein